MGGGRKELGGRDGEERREGKLWQGCKKYKIKQQKPKQTKPKPNKKCFEIYF